MGDSKKDGTPPILRCPSPVDGKGATDQAITWIVNSLEEAGYSCVGITLKSDQEPAVLA